MRKIFSFEVVMKVMTKKRAKTVLKAIEDINRARAKSVSDIPPDLKL